MRSQSGLSCRLAVVMCVAVLMGVMGTALYADDYEGPIDPIAATSAPTEFGDVSIETSDLSGTTVDAKEVLDPQVTALLAAGDIEETSDEVITATVQPVLEISE